jgi:hypothetical protein
MESLASLVLVCRNGRPLRLLQQVMAVVQQELVPVVEANPGGCCELVDVEELSGIRAFFRAAGPIEYL